MLKNGSIYLLANILYAAVPFLMIPVLTRALTPAEYGQIAIFQMLTAGLAGIIGFNGTGASARHHFEDVSEDEKARYNTNCIYILFFSVLVVLAIFSLFSTFLTQKLSLSFEMIVLAVGVSAFSFIIQLRLVQWQVQKQAVNYGLFQVSNGLALLVFVFIFLFTIEKTGAQYILANFVSTLILSVMALFSLCKSNSISWSLPRRTVMTDIMIFGAPLVPHVFGGFLLTSFDRVIINDHFGLALTGIYTLAFQLSMALKIVFDAINKSFVPYLYEILKRDDAEEKLLLVKRTYLWYVVLFAAGLLGFIIGPELLVLVAGSAYKQAAEIISYLIVGQIFYGMYFMVTNYIFYAKKTALLSLITIFSGGVNIGLILVMIPVYGLKGAAWSFCLSMSLRFLLTWALASRVIHMPWRLQTKK
ncbi:lipopolysaccharide biosynthesis protein [Siccibacter colletis]|uniref:lipopolysaccharide biosynthesis protein n=1 Tax=Siccibacter colletis TaxID=1505757 RepID=UPI003CEB27E1